MIYCHYRCFARLTFTAAMVLALAVQAVPSQKIATQYASGDARVPAEVKGDADGTPWTGAEKGPVNGLRLLARESNGAIWLGSSQGAARFDASAHHRWERWQYFAGRRWLPDDDVRRIWVDAAARWPSVWVRTGSGVAHLEWRPMSLEEKARLFEDRIEARHVRFGLVAGSNLTKPGDLSSSQTRDDDNDGLWTAMYLAAESWRFAATHSPDARTKARRGLEALMRLESITGVPGLYARSLVPTQPARPFDPQWHPTPDGQWLWKGDTSSDESVGHYYGYSLFYDLVADAEEKERIRGVVSRMTDYLIKHDYDLIDVTGQPTRWGRWSEAYFQTEEGKYESALRSLQLLSFLKTTYHITGNSIYQKAYLERVGRGYAQRMQGYRRWVGGGEINFSDDELAYLSYDPLLRYENDAKLRALYLDGLRFTWSQVRPDMNPLWNYISAASGAWRMTREIREESRLTLERIPMDLVDWGVRNSQRLDVHVKPVHDRQGHLELEQVLAPDERPVSKWNSNPYEPDEGGGGGYEDDGAFFLLPYWMGRFHGWVK